MAQLLMVVGAIALLAYFLFFSRPPEAPPPAAMPAEANTEFRRAQGLEQEVLEKAGDRREALDRQAE